MDNPVITSPIKELFKEFALINRKSVFADQARIEFPKGEANPFDLEILLTPTNGPFKDACVRFSIKLPPTYPKAAPTVKCMNRIFHPNVSTTGSVCFSMFSGDFNANYRLEHYINGLLWFLQNPNPDSALNSVCSIRNPKEYEAAVRTAISGAPTRGKVYDRIIVLDASSPEVIISQFFIEMAARQLGLRAMLDAYTGPMPALCWLKLVKGTEFDAEVIKLVGVSSATVAVRAKRLKVAESLVMKELVIKVGDKFVLVLTRGSQQLDFARIASLFDVKALECKLASILDISTTLKLSHRAIPAFGHGDLFAATLVSSAVDAEPDTTIYTATGVPNLIMKTTFKHMRPFLVNARVADFLQPAPPAASVPDATPATATATPSPSTSTSTSAPSPPVAPAAMPAPTVAVVLPTPTAAPAAAAAAAAVPQPDVTTSLISAHTQLISLLQFTSPSPTAAAAAADMALSRQQHRRALGVST